MISTETGGHVATVDSVPEKVRDQLTSGAWFVAPDYDNIYHTRTTILIVHYKSRTIGTLRERLLLATTVDNHFNVIKTKMAESQPF